MNVVSSTKKSLTKVIYFEDNWAENEDFAYAR